MTAHDHREFVEGCYRCDLSRDEVTEYMPTMDDVRDAALSYSYTLESVAEFDRVLAAHDAEVAAKALTDFADAHRMPNDWILFIGPDEVTVTVNDLLRERAAALRASTGGENRG